MLSRSKLKSGLRQTLSDVSGYDIDEMTDQTNVTDDLGLESLDDLDLVFRLEKALSVKGKPQVEISRMEYLQRLHDAAEVEGLGDVVMPSERIAANHKEAMERAAAANRERYPNTVPSTVGRLEAYIEELGVRHKVLRALRKKASPNNGEEKA